MTVVQFVVDAAVLLAAAVAVVLLSQRVRIPAVVGLLLAGVLVGPSGLGLVHDVHEVELFAEIGVIFLLFSIGLELSFARLGELRRAFLVGGSLQCGLTIAAAAGLGVAAGLAPSRAVFVGFLVALSSTAVVLKLYGDRRETTTPQGKVITGILLFQDLLIVPMIVLTPVLAGAAAAAPVLIAGRLLLALLAVAVVFVVARRLMSPLLAAVARTRVRELGVLGAVLACLGMAALTAVLGFSLALGAFLAGIILSESEFSHQVVADTAPLRDLFTSIFFVSIGMLVDLHFVASHLHLLLGLAAGVVVLKSLVTVASVLALRFPLRLAAIVGLGLAQVGEFSFLLLEVGREHGMTSELLYQGFMGAAVLTMLLTPVLVAVAPRLTRRLGRREGAAAPGEPELQDHVVVVGFGPAGQTLARVLNGVGIPYRLVELNGDTVRRARREGEPILYGDASRREIQLHAGVPRARAVVFVISDIEAVRRSVRLARELNPQVHLVVRTRMQSQIEELVGCGADEVVAEEFETSLEILTRVLAHAGMPADAIAVHTLRLRDEGYRLLRQPST